MRKYLAVLTSILILAVIFSVEALASEETVLVDTEFTDLVYSSKNMEIFEYKSPVTNPQGTFNRQFTVSHPYTGGTSVGNVTYKVPDGAVITKFEVLFLRPLNDVGGWDLFRIYGGKGGDAYEQIGAANAMTPFKVSYNYVNGHGWYVTTTDATNTMLKEKGYNTLRIELITVAKEYKPPIGVQMIKIYYTMPSFETISADDEVIEENSIISANAEKLAINFNADVSKLAISDRDIILTMDDKEIPADFEIKGTQVILKLSETLKYGKNYMLKFSDAIRNGNIENIPEKFSFTTSESDFASSDEIINDDGNVCSASLKIRNFRKNDTKAIAVIMSYKDSQMLDKNYTVIDSLISGEITEVTTGEINSQEADEIIVMVWDNLFDMNPLIKEIKQ